MLHLVSEMGDDTRLLQIARGASERRAGLDTHEPTHPLATRPGHPSAFQVLASMALARSIQGGDTKTKTGRVKGRQE